MKKIFTSFFLSAICFSQAQTPGDWAFVSQAGGANSDATRSIVTDAAGNSYLAGYFDGSATFTGASTTFTLTSNGGNDVFVAKYDATGKAVWVVNAGGSQSDQGIGIAVDGNGDIYVTGNFNDTATFYGSSNLQLISNGVQDAFVAKYDGSGNVLWASSMGGLLIDFGSKIDVDASGNSYVVGYFQNDTLLFSSGADSLFSNGGSDGFVAKFDASGNEVWAVNVGGSGNDQANALVLDANTNIYITGSFLNTSYFGTASGIDSLVSAGVNDIFTAQLDANTGDVVWVRGGGSTLADVGQNVGVDASGNVYLIANGNNNCLFTSPLNNNITLTSNGSSDIFLVSYDPFGNLRWGVHAGGTNGEFGGGVLVNASNHVLITGGMGAGTSTFYGSSNLTLTSNGGTDLFIAEYDTAGGVLCTQSGGGSGFDRGWEVGSDAAGNSYVAGQFAGTATFQSTPTFTLTSVGGTNPDVFLGKWLSSCSATTGILAQTSTWTVFPNPSAGLFRITSHLSLGEITVTNNLGEIVLHKKSDATTEAIDLSTLPAGIYIMCAQGLKTKLIRE